MIQVPSAPPAALAPDQAWEVLKSADLVCSAEHVSAAVRRVAAEIARSLGQAKPLVLCVMRGGLIFSGRLLTLLEFPLDFDYLDVTRYRNTTSGGSIQWSRFPETAVRGRAVLVVDDILDEGHTMAAIRSRVLECGVGSFHCAVFADKEIGTPKAIAADFVGITVPNRYVFGFGMDVYGAWRNLPAVYALKEKGV
jgi:hypoxanthine phosphoribosyltransferase